MLTVMHKGVIEKSSDAVSDTMGIRKPFPDVYPCLSLLRVSGYIIANDVPTQGNYPALSTGVPQEN